MCDQRINLILIGLRRMIIFMRRTLLRWSVLVALGLILCGHLTELFDRWDHTLTTGNDVDYSIVLLAASAGLAVLVAKHLISLLGRSTEDQSPIDASSAVFAVSFCSSFDCGLSPPPLLPLRI